MRSFEEALGRDQAALLFTLGAVDKCVNMGLLKGGGESLRLTPRGAVQFDQLEAEGFKPTGEEVQLSLKAVGRGGAPQYATEDFMEFMVKMVDKWELIRDRYLKRDEEEG